MTGVQTCVFRSGNFSKLKNKNLKKYIPGDGVILKKTEVDFEKDDTVYDILKRICRQKDIAFIKEQKTGYSGIYIKSLGHLAEFDAGKKSGWMYTVNGEYPNLSCSQYKLGNRDKVVCGIMSWTIESNRCTSIRSGFFVI